MATCEEVTNRSVLQYGISGRWALTCLGLVDLDVVAYTKYSTVEGGLGFLQHMISPWSFTKDRLD
jgi:hypothetical protein